MQVISSKQRPRKITLYGSDGVKYAFLLKGHEDLRQDERVMQLFGLVNELLAQHKNNAEVDVSRVDDLTLQRYAVVRGVRARSARISLFSYSLTHLLRVLTSIT